MKNISLLAVTAFAVFMVGCTTATSILTVATVELNAVSLLPNLTAPERAWIVAAADGASCSSKVLPKGEPASQEAIDIGLCFANLPVIPAADQPYIQIAIASVEAFMALYDANHSTGAISAHAAAVESPVALKQNAYVRAGKGLPQLNSAMSAVQDKAAAIRIRLQRTK